MAKFYYGLLFALLVLLTSPLLARAEPVPGKITIEPIERKVRARYELPRKAAIDPVIALTLAAKLDDRVAPSNEVKVAISVPFSSR